METSQVWRFPKKYGELFKNISNEDIGKIIRALFLGEVNLEGLNKAYYDIIKCDLDNLEKSALNGKKGGRPKKQKTPGYENKKPLVMKNNNLNERESKKEEIENWIQHWNKIFLEKRTVTDILLQEYISIRKKYTLEEFKKGYNAYKDKKLKTKEEYGEFKFLLSPLAFLKNKSNGFISYL